MNIIDFHTHAFPDALAERAMPALEKEGGIKAALDGKISSLLASMDKAGVEVSVVCSIATKPAQYEGILEWSKTIASPRIIPFPSVHPAVLDAAAKVRAIAQAGFRGVKFHSYYQKFSIDEGRMFPLYAAARDSGLIVLVHCGFDPAFPRDRVGDPEQTLRAVEAFPGLALIATHLGGWEDWDKARKHLLGKPIYLDLSYSLEFMERDLAREFLLNHPADYLLFGTDSPWSGQKETIDLVRSFGLDEARENKILSLNARKLLGLAQE